MKINPIYDYVKLERFTATSGTRLYTQPDGYRVSSVTTILSATADTSGLDEWRRRVGLVEAERIRTEATGLGSLMHDHLEKHVKGIVRPSGNNTIRMLAMNMADQIINRGLIKVDEIWGLEESLYYPGLYAGTCDLCGIHNSTESIMDYKTATKMKTADMIEDYFLQTCAYAMAHNELYGTNIKKGVIFMVDRNLKYREFIVEGRQFQQCLHKWLKRLEVFLNSAN